MCVKICNYMFKYSCIITGLPAPELLSLDRSKLYEIWRPITSIAYFGKPSMSMANNLYFLVKYGGGLEVCMFTCFYNHIHICIYIYICI
jgi:hypothetical protein